MSARSPVPKPDLHFEAFGNTMKSNKVGSALPKVQDDSDDEDSKFVELGRKYFVETSIHGLKYIAERGRHIIERVFWACMCLLGWVIGAVLIYQVYKKWQQSPVLVSFDSSTIPLWTIPFPAFTLCNMNKVMKSRVDHVDAEIVNDPTNKRWPTEKVFIEEVCASHLAEDEESTADINIDGHELHEYLADLAQPCSKMILRCHFEGHDRNCSDIFQPVITDGGQCCSFNIMPESIMLKKELSQDSHHSQDEEDRWSGWNPEGGYSFDPKRPAANGDNSHHFATEPLPRRAVAPGLHMGLSIAVDVQKDQYYCSGTESVGFKGLMHMPSTNPEMVEFGFAINPGTENFIAVKPEMIHADDAIHSISHEKRACFLQEERSLTYYKYYSFLNCFMECTSNYTYKQCDCVAFHMPRDANNMPICSPDKNTCVEEATTVVEESAFDEEGEISECECLPACTDVSFPFQMSHSKISRADMLHLPKEMTDETPDYKDDEYVEENLAIIHIYHNHLHFLRHQRGALFTIVDFFSNIGGLLGLCMGFSAMSFIEFVYFFTMRFALNVRMPRSEN